MKIHVKSVKKNISYIVLTLILVMFTDTLWIRYANFNRFYLVIGIGVVALLIGLQKCAKRSFENLVIFLLPVVLSMLVNVDLNTLILFKISLIIIGWTIVNKADLNKLVNTYVNFMVFVAIFSLVCMMLRQMIMSMDFIPTINSGSYGTKTLFFTNVKIGTGNLYFLRNQGPFWEPGAYQAYLNIALMFLMFSDVKRKHKNIEIIILCITVVSTISTTGFVVLGLLFIAKLFSEDHSSIRSKVFIAIIFIVVVGIVMNNETINYLLFDKMNSSSNNNVSNATRLYSIMQNGKGIIQNPIFGIGPKKYQKLFLEATSMWGAVDTGVNTTTSLSVWALYGVLYFIIFNLGLLLFSKSIGKSNWVTVLIFIAIIVIYNTENMNYSIFFNFLPVWGYLMKGGDLFESGSNINGF